MSIRTLERAFATEIQAAKVARFIIDTILGRRPVNAKPIKNERLRLTLAIFIGVIGHLVETGHCQGPRRPGPG